MTTLHLRLLQQLLNHFIATIPELRDDLAPLAQSSITFALTQPTLKLTLNVDSEGVSVTEHPQFPRRCRIEGALPQLLKAQSAGGRSSDLSQYQIRIEGDLNVAQSLHQFMKQLPDGETALAALVGDRLAPPLYWVYRKVQHWVITLRDVLEHSLRDYFIHEQQLLPARPPVNTFYDAVDTLRDDVERFAAKLTLFEQQRQFTQKTHA